MCWQDEIMRILLETSQKEQTSGHKECWSWDKAKQHNLITRTITAISDNGLYLMDTSQSGLYPWWPWVFHLQLTATWTNSSMWLFLSREKSKRPVTWMRKSSGWPFLASEFCSASASAIRRWLALTITRSQGQKPACKDPWSQWPRAGHHAQGRLHSGF